MKIIFYNNAGVGHINPTLPIVRSLKQRGAEIIYHTTVERKPLVEATGAQFRNYGSDDYKAANYNPGKNFVQQLIPAAAGLLPLLCRELEEEAPDLLVHDSMAPWGYCLGKVSGIPTVCTVTTFALNPQIRQRMYDFYGIALDDVNRRAIAEIKSNYGVSLRLIDALGAYGDCNFVFTSAQFNPPLGEMPAQNFHFIGPMVAPRDEKIEFPLDEITNSGKKVIYMSIGTILGGEDPTLIELFKMLLAAFGGDQRFLLVLSIGRGLTPTALGDIPDNCLVYNYVPQLEVLQTADVFISHAGMNSINEGLYFNTPLVVIPISGDQFTNADRVAELEVGMKLPRAGLTAQMLRQAVLTVLEQSPYRENCTAISKGFRDCLGYDGALAMIEKRVASRR